MQDTPSAKPTTATPRLPLNRLSAGVGLLTLGSLLTELALTRIFSVLLWYHFAFLAISLVMVGLSAGAIAPFTLRRLNAPGAAGRWLPACALTAGLVECLAVPIMLQMRISESVSAAMLLRISAVCVLAMLPFFFIGLVTSLAVREAGERVSTVYAADLIGAALGCLLFVPVVDRLGAPLTVFVAGVCSAIAALLLQSQAAKSARRVGGFVVVLLLIVAAPVADRAGWLRIRFAKGIERNDIEERWNSFSRVALWKPAPDQVITKGISPRFEGPIPIEQYMIDIDAGANTPVLARPRSESDLDFLSYDLTGLPFSVVQPRETLVIGSGGGRDVVLAREFGARQVTAVEINPDIVDLVRGRLAEFCGDLYRSDFVDLHVEDGRHFLLRDDRKYDAIMLSLVDTWAASAAGAMSLTENLLYTDEAFDSYLRHLEPGGVLTLTRWLWQPPRETLRVVVQARHALKRIGVTDARRHIVVAANDNLACSMIFRSPLTDAQVEQLNARITELAFRPLHVPTVALDDPISQYLQADDAEAFYASYPFDIRPVSDNDPFFFFTLRPADTFRVLSMPEGRSQNIGVLILAVAGLTVILLAVVFVVVPLLLIRSRGLSASALPIGAFIAYFCALGVGFMLVEIPLIQSFILLLGTPSAALSVVLFALLLGGGLGSFWTRVWPVNRCAGRLTLCGAIIVVLVSLYSWGLPGQLARLAQFSMGGRAAVIAALILPVGICMGTFFPSGLRSVAGVDTRWIPWAMGLNAVTSVLGSVIAIICGMLIGFRGTMLIGLTCYAIALIAARRLSGAIQTDSVQVAG